MTRTLGCVVLLLCACGPVAARNVVDSLPQIATVAVPFRYPVALYEQRVEGDVTLRVHVDTNGTVVPESLRVVESSGNAQLDAAAMEGAPTLLFRPARLGGRAVPFTVLFPVKFRVLEVRPPADTNPRRPRRESGKS